MLKMSDTCLFVVILCLYLLKTQRIQSVADILAAWVVYLEQ